MPKTITLGLIQMHCKPKREENLEKALAGIADVAAKGAQIVCMPELFLGPYFCQERDSKYFALAEPVPGPTTEQFSKLAKEKKIVILLSIYEQAPDGKRYNTIAVINANGKFLGKYRKMHVPNDPEYGYDETFYFAPGDLEWRGERSPHCGFQVFDTTYGKISPMVCYDQWFPEGARACAEKGAEIIFYPTAIGWPDMVREHKIYKNAAEHDAWQVTQRSHAIDNHVFVAAVNRVQREKGLNFWGTSFVCDPYGVVLQKASTDKEENLVVECDLSLIEMKRKDWPFLTERRGYELR